MSILPTFLVDDYLWSIDGTMSILPTSLVVDDYLWSIDGAPSILSTSLVDDSLEY